MEATSITHNIPHVSQYTDLTDPHWQYRGCGIAALKMLMNYWHGKNTTNLCPSLDELLQTGLRIGAYMENVGWSHRGLINIAREYGYDGFNIDEPNAEKKTLWTQMKSDLEKQPLMASVYTKLDPTLGGGHIIVLADSNDDSVAINDPEDIPPVTGTKTIPLNTFLNAWKRRYIVIYPQK